jgi:hypothetical protein
MAGKTFALYRGFGWKDFMTMVAALITRQQVRSDCWLCLVANAS